MTGKIGTNHAEPTRAGAHSFEAKAFDIICTGYMDDETRQYLVSRNLSAAVVLDGAPRAATMFVDLTGSQIGDMLSDEEGIAYAQFDLSRCVEPKQFHDVVGYHNRFDVFSLAVNRDRHEPVTWRAGNAPTARTDDASFLPVEG
jgi:aliphatic nitrilase